MTYVPSTTAGHQDLLNLLSEVRFRVASATEPFDNYELAPRLNAHGGRLLVAVLDAYFAENARRAEERAA